MDSRGDGNGFARPSEKTGSGFVGARCRSGSDRGLNCRGDDDVFSGTLLSGAALETVFPLDVAVSSYTST